MGEPVGDAVGSIIPSYRRNQIHPGKVFCESSSVTRPPKQEVLPARFRDELYTRLGCVAFVLPPLRRHIEDVVPLAKRFIVKYGVEFVEEAESLDPTFIIFLKQYHVAGVGRFIIGQTREMFDNGWMLILGTQESATVTPCSSL